MDISPVIIVKNASRTLAQTLESLKEFDEVIVYDTGSEDNTIDIAQKYKNVKLFKGKFSGFGKSKNEAALLASNDWIFSIDGDEVVSPELMNSIRNLDLDLNCTYCIKRYNYYRKQRIKYSGWGLDLIYRIYNRKKAMFNEKMVHEQVEKGESTIITLNGELKHYSFSSISDFIQKGDFYSELFAAEYVGKRKSSISLALIKSIFVLFKTIFIKLAFLDGYRGILIAVSNSVFTFYKYLKLYEKNTDNDKTVSLIISTYNWKEALHLTLQSVINQKVPPDEIIIADDGSRADTREFIEGFAKTCYIPIIHSWQEDDGFRLARSRNLAISRSSSDYVIFIDGDLILHRNFVLDHYKNARKGYFLQGSRVLLNENLTKKIINQGKYIIPSFYSRELTNKLNSINNPLLSWLYSIKKSRSHNSIRGCNISFYKEDLIKVNGFNEDFVGWGREDSEIVERLYNSGVLKKRLKFAGIQYHLFHRTGKASNENESILTKAITEKLKWCKNGLNQHLNK